MEGVRPICGDCRRPIFQWPGEEYWWHEDARFDQVDNPFGHYATLYQAKKEEAKV